MKKLCILDLDGTLLDTIEDIADSANGVLSAYGFKTLTTEEVKKVVGRGAKNLLMDCLPKGKSFSEDEILKFYKQFKDEYNNRCMDKTKPYNGINEMLLRLHENGIKLAVLSNKPNEMTNHLVDFYFKEIPFVFVSGEVEGVAIKPDPKAAFNIMSLVGAEKTETVMIGDSEVDIKFANNAGIDCIGVLWGFREKKVLTDNNPTYIVEAPNEIIDIVLEK